MDTILETDRNSKELDEDVQVVVAEGKSQSIVEETESAENETRTAPAESRRSSATSSQRSKSSSRVSKSPRKSRTKTSPRHTRLSPRSLKRHSTETKIILASCTDAIAKPRSRRMSVITYSTSRAGNNTHTKTLSAEEVQRLRAQLSGSSKHVDVHLFDNCEPDSKTALLRNKSIHAMGRNDIQQLEHRLSQAFSENGSRIVLVTQSSPLLTAPVNTQQQRLPRQRVPPSNQVMRRAHTEILVAVLILFCGVVGIIVGVATGEIFWVYAGGATGSLGVIFCVLGVCWVIKNTSLPTQHLIDDGDDLRAIEIIETKDVHDLRGIKSTSAL